jgi:glycine/D-amino acid oxidase-like deaminating enzyme
MAIESRSLWRELERGSGRELLVTTGGLDVGERIEENGAALEACDVAFEFATGAAVKARFSSIRVDDDAPVLIQPDSGVVAADAAVATFQHGTEAAGGEIRTRTTVQAIEPGTDDVRIVTQFGEVTATACIVTAGAWVKGLVEPLGLEVPVKPTRETVAYFELEGIPPTLVEWGDPAIYGLSTLNGSLKVGEHIAGPQADPDEEGGINEASVEGLREWAAAHYPTATPKEHLAETCLYTNTPDENFILERHERVVIGSPCSGHGFKFAPLIGERLAALAAEVL